MPKIKTQNRLIVALDVPTVEQAFRLVDQLGDLVTVYKVGFELFLGTGWALLDALASRGKKLFIDFKLLDIPLTVARSVMRIRDRATAPPLFTTVHATSADALQAAVGFGVPILGVTVLTSEPTQPEVVVERAVMALEAGCTGVVCAAADVPAIRAKAGTGLIYVCPGIRPRGGETQDQRRVSEPAEALRSGADYLVVGRPIRDAKNPADAAAAIQETIAYCCSGKESERF